MRLAPLLLLLACNAPAAPPTAHHTDFDIRIVNGDVIDGTGRTRVHADVGIRADAIAAIGDLSHKTSAITIDARHEVSWRSAERRSTSRSTSARRIRARSSSARAIAPRLRKS